MVLGEDRRIKEVYSSFRARNEEERLFLRYQKRRSIDARNKIVERYFPLVKKVAGRFIIVLPRTVDPGDMYDAASLGLIHAVESYDLSRGVPFPNYAEIKMKGSMLDELRNEDWLSRPARTLVSTIEDIREELAGVLQREPSEPELVAKAQERGIDANKLRMVSFIPINGRAMMSQRGFPMSSGVSRSSTYRFSSHDDEGADIESLVYDTHKGPEHKATIQEIVKKVYKHLSLNERRVVHLRYWENLSFREIGEMMHLTESRVCRIHTDMVKRFKTNSPLRYDLSSLLESVA